MGDRAAKTRIVAMFMIAGITAYAMHLEIDGIFVPIAGVAIIAGIAGYETGIVKDRDISEMIKDKG